MKPYVLICNDDGILSNGLRALADAFWDDGWRVTVCAPHQERSASAHSITIKRPVVTSSVRWEGMPEEAEIAVFQTDGTPADCVKVALLNLCESKPDLVVSGINNGWNCGTDVHYSGTVGAAMEAAFNDVPAIAVSSARGAGGKQNEYAAALATRMARKLIEKPLPMPSVLNINVPDCEPEAVKGIVEAPLTCIRYTDRYHSMRHERGRTAYWLSGEIIEEGCLPGGDLDCLLKGFVAVTVLGWDLTRDRLLNGMID